MDNRTIFAQQKHGSPKQPQRRAAAADCVVGSTRDFPLNARSVRKMRERTVPTLALILLIKILFPMVCFCLGRVDNRTIFAQQKHGSPKRPQRRAAAADCVVGSTRDFPLNARGVRKMRERTVPTLALICTPKVRHFWGAYQFTAGFLLRRFYRCK